MDRLLVNFWVILLLNAIVALGLQLQVESNSGTYSSNANIGIAVLMGIVMLGGLTFVGLKIKLKDKTITFRSYSRHYPMFYICTQLAAVVIIVFTYYSSSLLLFVLLLPQGMIFVWFLKMSPHGKFKSFINITGLFCQLIPIVATALFALNNYMVSSMMGTISAFIILVLCLAGEGLSIARLVLKYREDKSKVKQSAEAEKVKMEA